MKNIRRLAALMLALIMMFTCTGCMYIPLGSDYYDYAPETIGTVEIYDLRNKDVTSSSFLETELPVYTVPEEQKAEFVADVGTIEFKMFIFIVLAAVDPSFDYGDWAIRLNRVDGSYVLMSDFGYVEIYDENGERTEYRNYPDADRECWKTIINTYVPPEILLISPYHKPNAMVRR